MALIGFHLGSSAATNPFLNDSGDTPILKQQQKVKKKKSKGDETIPPPTYDLKNIPDVKFVATDPCDPGNLNSDAMPWEETAQQEIILPEGIEPMIPEPLPDIAHLALFDYRAAVSVAFEGMRLIYGIMPDEETRKFEQAWAPLFDYPSQEIVDYLNRLNPLISQFLAARESYMRCYSSVQLVMLDAATAVEWDDPDAFYAAIGEARMHTSGMESLDAAMKELANRIQQLGNPPNPNDAKCEAHKRYKRLFRQEEEEVYLGECWIGTSKSPYQALGLDELQEPLLRYLLIAKVNGKNRYFAVQLSESEPCSSAEIEEDEACLSNIRVEQLDIKNLDGSKPDITSDGTFRSYFPKVPVMYITKLTLDYLRLNEYARVKDEDRKNPGLVAEKEDYQIACKHYGTRILRSGFFFQTALEWSQENRWSQYPFDKNGMMSNETIEAFEEAVRENIRADMAEKKKSRKQRREEEKNKQLAQKNEKQSTQEKMMQDSLALENQAKEESIAFRQEIIASIQQQIDREYEYKQNVSERLALAKSDAEVSNLRKEIADIDMRIMGFSSTMQSERDAIATLRTGEVVHTRTAFDEYAREKMIYGMLVDAARRDATRRTADIVERQIQRLPPQQRDKAWELAEKVIDGKALVSGDVERVQSLARSLNRQLEGYALQDQALQEEIIAESELKEAGAQAVVIAAGSIAVGLGSSALAGAYGAESAAAIYGTKALGAIYGGVTGYLSGGAKEGAMQAASFWSPVTGSIASFVNGYYEAGKSKDATTYSQVWEGVKSAGTYYVVGKVFEMGVGVVMKGSAAVFGKESRLFKPMFGSPQQRSKVLVDMARTNRSRLKAENAVKAFKNLDNQRRILQLDEVANAAKISEVKKELSQLAANMNADYHAKWHFKYKAEPRLRNSFDWHVQENYKEMIPRMTESLKKQGYDVSRFIFKQFRNASSGGSSSMDLDLAPVHVKSGKEPIVFFKNRKIVKADEFMRDAQQAMNKEYYEMFGVSAKHSEMNLTTSAHPEAFSTPELLKKDIDFSKLSAEDVASIGKVLDAKLTAIENNQLMSKTTQLQAKCREASKEIDNMLLPKLRQELAETRWGSSKYWEKKGDIDTWENLLGKLKQIGTETNNPVEIHRINHEIYQFTGGRDASQVVSDLTRVFGFKK